MSKYKVKNAIIMAAGLSSRFAPLSYEYPKALIKVKGEVLIERQIKQLRESGISDITVVVGYKRELFYYLKDKFQVKIIENSEYDKRNNNSSIYAIKDILSNTYICSADNYFMENVFENIVDDSYYSSVFIEGDTDEWCIETDDKGIIKGAEIGGKDCWVMLGHVFFSEDFSKKFINILEGIYENSETHSMLWEDIYLKHIDKLNMYIKKYKKGVIFEFDTLDELREFDESYKTNSNSMILKEISNKLNCSEGEICKIEPICEKGTTKGFDFSANGKRYNYIYETNKLRII